jgi:hypothetical protein
MQAGGMLESVGRSELPTVQQFSFSVRDITCPIGELGWVGKNAVKHCQPLTFNCICFWAMGKVRMCQEFLGKCWAYIPRSKLNEPAERVLRIADQGRTLFDQRMMHGRVHRMVSYCLSVSWRWDFLSNSREV